MPWLWEGACGFGRSTWQNKTNAQREKKPRTRNGVSRGEDVNCLFVAVQYEEQSNISMVGNEDEAAWEKVDAKTIKGRWCGWKDNQPEQVASTQLIV